MMNILTPDVSKTAPEALPTPEAPSTLGGSEARGEEEEEEEGGSAELISESAGSTVASGDRDKEQPLPRGARKFLKEREKQARAAEGQAKRFRAVERQRLMVKAEGEQKATMLQVREEQIERVRAKKDFVSKDAARASSMKSTFKAAEAKTRKKAFELASAEWAAEQLRICEAKLATVEVIQAKKVENRSHHAQAMILNEKEQKEITTAVVKESKKQEYAVFCERKKQLTLLDEISKKEKRDKEDKERILKMRAENLKKQAEQESMKQEKLSFAEQLRKEQEEKRAAKRDAARWAQLATQPTPVVPPAPVTPPKTPPEISLTQYKSLSSSRYSTVASLPQAVLEALDSSHPVCKKKWK